LEAFLKTQKILSIILLLMGILLPVLTLATTASSHQEDKAKPSRLMVLWTSGDREVALKMVYLYTFNAKKRGWWDQIHFIVWGPSSKLLASDPELQAEIKKMIDVGVEVLACKACADLYGVSDKLTALGIEVKYMGVPMTDMLKQGWTSLTF
jgi:hypothetical protein